MSLDERDPDHLSWALRQPPAHLLWLLWALQALSPQLTGTCSCPGIAPQPPVWTPHSWPHRGRLSLPALGLAHSVSSDYSFFPHLLPALSHQLWTIPHCPSATQLICCLPPQPPGSFPGLPRLGRAPPWGSHSTLGSWRQSLLPSEV